MLIWEKRFLGDGKSTFFRFFEVIVDPHFQYSFLLKNIIFVIFQKIIEKLGIIREGKLCVDCRLCLRRVPTMATDFQDELKVVRQVWPENHWLLP